jgi:hypothetical protein
MLKLPPNWHQIPGGALARALGAQIQSRKLRAEFARHMITASFGLWDAGVLKREGRIRRVRALPGLRWRLGKGIYAYLSEVNDDAMHVCARCKRTERVFTVIVPEGHDELFRNALEAFAPKSAPTVYSLSGFICWRTMWGGTDLGLSHLETNAFLLRQYHRGIANRRTLAALMISDADQFLKRSRKLLSMAPVSATSRT